MQKFHLLTVTLITLFITTTEVQAVASQKFSCTSETGVAVLNPVKLSVTLEDQNTTVTKHPSALALTKCTQHSLTADDMQEQIDHVETTMKDAVEYGFHPDDVQRLYGPKLKRLNSMIGSREIHCENQALPVIVLYLHADKSKQSYLFYFSGSSEEFVKTSCDAL